MKKPCAGTIYRIGGKDWCVGERKITKNPQSKYRAIEKTISKKTGKVKTKRIRNSHYKPRKTIKQRKQ
jgi:hypothetical protein